MAVNKTLIPHIPSFAPTFPVDVRGNCDVSYGSTDGPFCVIDAHNTGDRIYINRVTMNELAEAFGFLSPEDVVKLHGEIEQLRVRVAELEDELAVEQADKVVPLAEVIDLVVERERRRPTPEAA